MTAKYDVVTRWLHAALAAGVIIELALLSVMHVPPGPGLGLNDWHRKAFELHCRIGPTVAVICALQWLWICLPFSRPGVSHLFPWLRRDKRRALRREFINLLKLQFPDPNQENSLIGTVHGLGLSAVTGSVIGGVISYLGYFMGVPIPGHVLHLVALEQIFMSWLVWAFVIGHLLMALRHFVAGNRSIFGIFRLST